VKVRARLNIGTKLVTLIAVLLVASIVSLVWVSTRMFTEDNTALIQQMNADTATSLSNQMREYLNGLTDKMRILGTLLGSKSQSARTNEETDRVEAEFFAKDTDLLAVLHHAVLPEKKRIGRSLANEVRDSGETWLDSVDSQLELTLVRDGAPQVTQVRLPDETMALAIAVPFIPVPDQPGKFSETLTAIVKQGRFNKAFGESALVTAYLVDRRGQLLVHSDLQRSSSGENLSYLPIVKRLIEGKFNNEQTRYMDPQTQEARLAAYRMAGFAGLGVVAEVPEAKALETSQKLERRSVYIAFGILCVTFLVGYLFSGTISWPIRELAAAAERISNGDFKIALKPRAKDEVGDLAVAFNGMAKGLEERDRYKSTFEKFHNKEIADKLLSGEVKLGGERKEAVIFFSDVRGFTAMSESMEPEQVVEMLNEYMTRMVSIIRAHHGIVDKYVGDAIMAIWGVPMGTENDATNAVMACLRMREELAKLNELRLSRGQNELRIGMGLNMGQVIAGNIGSEDKMEYTVIGDSVNLASRMESLTKEYGTDFLIPRVIEQRCSGKFIFEQSKSAKVKGKSQGIEVFKVKGYIDPTTNSPVIIETPYSSYESEKSDKVVHDPEPAAPSMAAAPPLPVPPPFRHRDVAAPPLGALEMPPEASAPHSLAGVLEAPPENPDTGVVVVEAEKSLPGLEVASLDITQITATGERKAS
jgi:adenylate cyclase